MTKAAILIASLALLATTVPVETVRAEDLSWKDPTAAVEVLGPIHGTLDPNGAKGR
jgi:hypothetical protein